MEQEKLIYHSEYGGDTEVKLEILPYLNNGRLGISLVGFDDGMPEPFGSLTVNINAPAPDYCGYLDTNNLLRQRKSCIREWSIIWMRHLIRWKVLPKSRSE